MGTTIAFYSAHAPALIAVFTSLDEQAMVEALRTYPVADFSLHLLLPDDLDRFCQILRRHHLALAPTFRELLVEQLWFDGLSESLTIVAQSAAQELASISEAQLAHVAQEWSEPFHYHKPLSETPAYHALMQLRHVAQDAVTKKKSLILHLLG